MIHSNSYEHLLKMRARKKKIYKQSIYRCLDEEITRRSNEQTRLNEIYLNKAFGIKED